MNSISAIVFSLVLVLSVQHQLTKYLLVELEGKFHYSQNLHKVIVLIIILSIKVGRRSYLNNIDVLYKEFEYCGTELINGKYVVCGFCARGFSCLQTRPIRCGICFQPDKTGGLNK
jgi:hypothetical protein